MENALSISYAIPYITLGVAYIILAYWEKIRKTEGLSIFPIRYMSVLLFLFFFGFRGHLMTDFMGYYKWFDAIPTMFSHNIGSLFGEIDGEAAREPGFMIYTCLVKTIWPNYYFWVFINALCTILVLDWFFNKYSTQYALAYLIFLAFLGLGMEINTFRNVKSIALFLLSIQYIEKRKPLKYLTLNVLGVLFHTSSLLYLPLYWLLRRKLSPKILWIIFGVANAIFILKIPFIIPVLDVIGSVVGGRISHLINVYTSLSFDVNYGFSIGFFERNISFVLITILYKRLTTKNHSNVIFCNLFVLYFVTFFCFSEIKVITDRVPMLFICAYWVLYPQMISEIRLLANKVFLTTFVVVLSLLKIATGTDNILCRYDNLLLGEIESFENRSAVYYSIGHTVVK